MTIRDFILKTVDSYIDLKINAYVNGKIKETFDKGGNVVIPSFAVGRTQEMLYFLRKIKTEGMVEGYPDFPVYVDSPLAVEATGIFQKNICS